MLKYISNKLYRLSKVENDAVILTVEDLEREMLRIFKIED